MELFLNYWICFTPKITFTSIAQLMTMNLRWTRNVGSVRTPIPSDFRRSIFPSLIFFASQKASTIQGAGHLRVVIVTGRRMPEWSLPVWMKNITRQVCEKQRNDEKEKRSRSKTVELRSICIDRLTWKTSIKLRWSVMTKLFRNWYSNVHSFFLLSLLFFTFSSVRIFDGYNHQCTYVHTYTCVRTQSNDNRKSSYNRHV